MGDDSDGETRTELFENRKAAWERTVEDLEARADAREAEGWQTTSVAADHTLSEGLNDGSPDQFGFVHVVPEDAADRLEEALESGTYTEYDVFYGAGHTRVFFVLELLDREEQNALLVAGSYDHPDVDELVTASINAGSTYSYFRTVEGTTLGSFEHEDPEKFFPAVDFEALAG